MSVRLSRPDNRKDFLFTEKDYLGFAEQKDSDEIGGWQVGLEVVDFAYGAS